MSVLSSDGPRVAVLVKYVLGLDYRDLYDTAVGQAGFTTPRLDRQVPFQSFFFLVVTAHGDLRLEE